jgi:hypothetical protein
MGDGAAKIGCPDRHRAALMKVLAAVLEERSEKYL